MSKQVYIERNPKVMLGKPVIKGTRITVELIMRKLADGFSMAELLKSYPNLNEKQVLAAFSYAADMIANEDIIEAA